MFFRGEDVLQLARTPIIKNLTNSRLLKSYASWVYCDACGNTVAYLCYVTYDQVDFSYTCACGSCGRVEIEFAHEASQASDTALIPIKNRLCCPADQSTLITIVEKNVTDYTLFITCNTCNTVFSKSRQKEPYNG